jgi:hypothetical protein
MLKRLDPRQARNRRYSLRQKAGLIVVKIEIGPTQIDRLIAAQWLPRHDVHERQQIEVALQAMIDASLK